MKRIAHIGATTAGAFAIVLAVAPAAHAGFTSDFSLSKTHPAGTYMVGQQVTFTLDVHAVTLPDTNGNTITVTDTLPSGLTYVSFSGGADSWSCSPSGQTVTCTGTPPLNSGGDSTFTITTLIGPTAVPSVTNNATLSAGNDQNANDNSASDDVNVQAASSSPTPSPTKSPKPTPAPTHHPSPTPTPAVLPTSGARLPFTGPGHHPLPLILGAVGLFAFGGVLAAVGRRRRAS